MFGKNQTNLSINKKLSFYAIALSAALPFLVDIS